MKRNITNDIRREEKSGKYYTSRFNTVNEAYSAGNSTLRNPLLYSFLKRDVAAAVVKTLTANGIKAELDTKEKKVMDITIKVKKGDLDYITFLSVNSYMGKDGEIGVVPISNHKFVNAKANGGFVFVSPDDNCVYIIPSVVLQANWRNIMLDERSVRTVIDAIGMRNEISPCDVEKLRDLASTEGDIYVMPQEVAEKYKAALDKYKETK